MITRQDVIDIANEIYLDDCIWIDDSDCKPINDLVKFAERVEAKVREKIKHSLVATSVSVQTRVYVGDEEISMLKMTHKEIQS